MPRSGAGTGWLGSLGAGLLTLVLLGSPARAYGDLGYSIEVGAWAGGAYGTDSGAFGNCSVSAGYESDIVLILGLESGNFFIGLVKESWALGQGTSYPLSIAVDGRAVRSVSALGDGDTLWLEMGADVAFFRAVQEGQVLYVDAAREDFEFELKGTKAALNRVAACVVAFTGDSLIGDPTAVAAGKGKDAEGNPFGETGEAAAAAPAGKGGKAGFFDPDEVLKLLDEADFPRAVLLPEYKLPLFEGESPFMAWLSEDEELPIAGFLLFVPQTDQPRQALQAVLQLVVESCPYAVASGLDPLVERAGVRVAGGRVICEDESSIDVTYFAATAKRQGVYVFAHTGDKTTQFMTRDINDKLKDRLLGFSY